MRCQMFVLKIKNKNVFFKKIYKNHTVSLLVILLTTSIFGDISLGWGKSIGVTLIICFHCSHLKCCHFRKYFGY